MLVDLQPLYDKIPDNWSPNHRLAPTLASVFRVFTLEDLKLMFMAELDPTGVAFTNKVLHNDHVFYETLLATKELGPYLITWQNNCADSILGDVIAFHKEVMADKSASLSARSAAARSLSAIVDKHTKLAKQVVAAKQEAKRAVPTGNASSVTNLDTDEAYTRMLEHIGEQTNKH